MTTLSGRLQTSGSSLRARQTPAPIEYLLRKAGPAHGKPCQAVIYVVHVLLTCRETKSHQTPGDWTIWRRLSPGTRPSHTLSTSCVFRRVDRDYPCRQSARPSVRLSQPQQMSNLQIRPKAETIVDGGNATGCRCN